MPHAKQSPAAKLLGWYDVHRRVLPWRAPVGCRSDPYGVWLSEIMLQQTTVAAVEKYFQNFLVRWPSIEALAQASLDEVRAAWSGLGYYSRARNLHRTAVIVARERDGCFPADIASLRKLPGIGPYTAGAIAAIAFDAPEAAVDANAERVLARYFRVEMPLPNAKAKLHHLAGTLVPEKRAGDFAQALMDLGALVCTPKRPDCTKCPWSSECRGRRIAESLPRKTPKRSSPLKRGAAFVARDQKGSVLLVKRPDNGLLGGMLQPPLGPWNARFPSREQAQVQAPFEADWQRLAGVVRHGFTHFKLEIEVWCAEVKKRQGRGVWLSDDQIRYAALPTVMRKIVAHAIKNKDSSQRTRRMRRGSLVM